MDISALFQSNYLKASDLQGQARRVIIESCLPEQIGQAQEIKPVLKFRGVPRGLVLNKTNAQLLAASFGTETDRWIGQAVELYPENVIFQGRVTAGIRVRAALVAQTPAPATATAADPFANAAPVSAPAAPVPPAPTVQATPTASVPQPEQPAASVTTGPGTTPTAEPTAAQGPQPEQAALPLGDGIDW